MTSEFEASEAIDFQTLRCFKRINVIGTSGSGKSTFARQLGEILDLPYFEMDQLFWKPDWQGSPDDEFYRKLDDVTARDRWVLDGNYTRTTLEKWKRVQLVVWLDLSFARTVSRVTRRAIGRSLTQQELWPPTGNRETLRKAFLSKDSIIWWAITTYRRNRRNYTAAMIDPKFAHIHFLRLRSPAEVAACLDGLRRAIGVSSADEQRLER